MQAPLRVDSQSAPSLLSRTSGNLQYGFSFLHSSQLSNQWPRHLTPLQERRHDASRGMGLLIEDWVSRASALQRKGRAGRVQEGMCFSLFTRQRFEHQMRKFQVCLSVSPFLFISDIEQDHNSRCAFWLQLKSPSLDVITSGPVHGT